MCGCAAAAAATPLNLRTAVHHEHTQQRRPKHGEMRQTQAQSQLRLSKCTRRQPENPGAHPRHFPPYAKPLKTGGAHVKFECSAKMSPKN